MGSLFLSEEKSLDENLFTKTNSQECYNSAVTVYRNDIEALPLQSSAPVQKATECQSTKVVEDLSSEIDTLIQDNKYGETVDLETKPETESREKVKKQTEIVAGMSSDGESSEEGKSHEKAEYKLDSAASKIPADFLEKYGKQTNCQSTNWTGSMKCEISSTIQDNEFGNPDDIDVNANTEIVSKQSEVAAGIPCDGESPEKLISYVKAEYRLNSESKIPTDIVEKYGKQTKCYKNDAMGYSIGNTGSRNTVIKKKKWKSMNLDDLGLNLSLFPRPMKDNVVIDESATSLFDRIEAECDARDALTESWEGYQEIEGNASTHKKILRADRDRKVAKAHKQVKSKYCRNVRNNQGRKHLYIKHRVYKLIDMESQRLSYLPSRRKEKLDLKREEMKQLLKTPARRYNTPSAVAPIARPQNLAHALDHNNAASDINSNIVSLLIGLQHRDLTPEDYEILLQLDESVAPKTISDTQLESFRTETISESLAGELCPICMEIFELNQVRKYLPCNHGFHAHCIDMWLKNSSTNCPVDNLPVDAEPS